MRVILLVLITNIFLYANLIKQQDLYEKGLYEESIAEAKNSKDDVSSYKYHLYWAKSAEALGDLDEAMSAYERVLFLDEENVEAMVALVNIYRYTDREALELQMSEKLKGYPLTQSQKESLLRSKNRQIHSLKLSASLVLGQDTNINSSPGSDVMDDYIGTTGSVGELSTLFARLRARLSYKNELGTKGGWYTKEEMRVYYQNNVDESYYNIFIGTLEAGMGYKGSGYSLYIPVSYDYIYYLEHSLYNQYKINPKLNVPLSQNLLCSINISLSKRRYIDNNEAQRDDTTQGIGMALYYLFDGNYIYLNAKYETMDADDANPATFIDKSLLSATLGVNYNLSKKLTTNLNYRYKSTNYDDTIGTTLVPSSEKREDDSNQISAKLSYTLSKKSELFFSETYTKNSSNYAPSEYNKNVLMLGVSVNY